MQTALNFSKNGDEKRKMDGYYTIKDASEYIGCSEKELRKFIRQHQIELHKLKMPGHTHPIIVLTFSQAIIIKSMLYIDEIKKSTDASMDMAYRVFFDMRYMLLQAEKTQKTSIDWDNLSVQYQALIENVCELGAMLYNWREDVRKMINTTMGFD